MVLSLTQMHLQKYFQETVLCDTRVLLKRWSHNVEWQFTLWQGLGQITIRSTNPNQQVYKLERLVCMLAIYMYVVFSLSVLSTVFIV